MRGHPSIFVHGGISAAAACALTLAFTAFAAAPARAQSDMSDDAKVSDHASGSQDAANASANDEGGARKTQAARHRALSHGGRDFDPRVYEARGRELQGEYYEIATMAAPPAWSPSRASRSEAGSESASENSELQTDKPHRFWLWASMAGLAGVAGTVGYLWYEHQAPAKTQATDLTLNDQPQ